MEKNNYKGIFALATGSGKTITALSGFIEIYKELVTKKKERICLVVLVNRILLAQQWVKEMKNFNIRPIEAWDSIRQWQKKFSQYAIEFNSNRVNFFSVVAVQKTFNSKVFQELLIQIPEQKIVFIGDECHNYGNGDVVNNIPNTKYKMGLSATPYTKNTDIEFKQRLTKNFGEIIAKYTLQQALKNRVLCPYEYHIHKCYLNDEEAQEILDRNKKISKLFAFYLSNPNIQYKNNINILASEVARIVGSIDSKYISLQTVLKDFYPKGISHALFYVGEGNNPIYQNNSLTRVRTILEERAIFNDQITADEKQIERDKIIRQFTEKSIYGIVAKRILDEGIDIPICKHAFLLASSKQYRQYVQRRGRVLRKHPNKKFSIIHDFFCVPTKEQFLEDEKNWIKFLNSELTRLGIFVQNAKNKIELIKKLNLYLNEFNLNYNDIEQIDEDKIFENEDYLDDIYLNGDDS